MASTSGRSSVVSERHRSMADVRSSPLSRISRPGSAVDMILDRIGAVHADTKESMAAIQADTRNSIEALHADIGAVQDNIIGVHANTDAVQAETREVLETVMHRLERLER